ncbi:hypothetical protein PVK06_007332 [Gossypium arboreum]|uniref:Uncharacterized protein n=1 Tax=Gossypium arboreum TaxID=29729 RepID=A0ABR0QIF3_GOSAR|nr:hypothetical protein PVK06_007332 [Gossypium arboreum]
MNGVNNFATVPVSSAMELIAEDVEGAKGGGILGLRIDIAVSLNSNEEPIDNMEIEANGFGGGYLALMERQC